MNSDLVARFRQLRLVVFDFDGVFTDNSVWVFEDGREAVRCTRADGIGLSKLKALGVETAIISTEKNPVVGHRARKLGIRCIQACDDKRVAVIELAGELSIPLQHVAFVGNDLNDLPACEAVGFPIAVADAHPDMVGTTLWRTQRQGGHGAVREVCDLIAQLHGEQGTGST
jgi:3-deoxy-D-manno-octulosonate 8-phosphate phosphatase (KDO 8-P phosphatase)